MPRKIINIMDDKKRNKEFGDFIHKRRIEKNFGLRESAKLLGISPAYLCRIEKGEVNPPLENKIIPLAKLLDIDYDVLLAKAGRISSDLTKKLEETMIRDMEQIEKFRKLHESGIDVQFMVTITEAKKNE